jgi:hypothetical protein
MLYAIAVDGYGYDLLEIAVVGLYQSDSSANCDTVYEISAKPCIEVGRLTELEQLLVHSSKLEASPKVWRQTCQSISHVLVYQRHYISWLFPRKLLQACTRELLLISAHIQSNFDQAVDISIFGYSYWHCITPKPRMAKSLRIMERIHDDGGA